jgi:hypothetical protein
LNWRRPNSFEVRSLFSAPARPPPQFRSVREFPKPVDVKFPFVRPGSAAAHKKAPQEFKSLMEVDWNPTPEEIAEFGVPLLPLPTLEPDLISGLEELSLEDCDADADADLYDEDGDPRYAACTPLRVGEEETTAPAVDAEHIVGFGPDVHDVSGNLV